MVFVHSFQPEPMLNSKFRNLDRGLKITLLDHAYSVECIHKFGHTIEVYTTPVGAEILKCIPYDKVHIIKNDITNSHHFAASIKFVALRNMSLDQYLIDGDIFLEKSIVFDFLKNLKKDMVVAMYEPRNKIFKSEEIYDLFKACETTNIPGYELPNSDEVKGWYNTSCLKFNNEDLKQEYIRQYIEHVKQAESRVFKGDLWPDIIYEQFNIDALLRNTNCQIDMVNPYYSIDDEFAYKIGFCHLGSAKEITHSYYLRKLQTENFQLTLDLQDHYLYLMNNYIPNLNNQIL